MPCPERCLKTRGCSRLRGSRCWTSVVLSAVLGISLPACAAADALVTAEQRVEEEQLLCESKGGVLVSISLSIAVHSPRMSSADLPESPADTGPVHICLPLQCASLKGPDCASIRRGSLEQLLARLSEEEDPAAEAVPAKPLLPEERFGGPNTAGSWPEESGTSTWFVDGVPLEADPVDRQTYAALNMATRISAGSGTDEHAPKESFRVAVVGTHGPLAVLAAEHLVEAWAGDPLDFVFYGQCYLCNELPLCQKHHVPSLADRGCEWFHLAPRQDAAKTVEEARAAAEDIAVRESDLSLVVCLGLLLCSYLFSALPSTVQRFHMLCMNPVQGVPGALARGMLQNLVDRPTLLGSSSIGFGEVFATNAVTSALLAYHMGLSSVRAEGDAALPQSVIPFLTLFPRALHEFGKRNVWKKASGALLLARNFLLLHSPVCHAFENALQQVWPSPVNYQSTRWNFADERELSELLQHIAVVYIPEHPYKNLFNDFYTLQLPIFVPGIGFLARLWPQVRHVERDATYDGWLDREIPAVRLGSIGVSAEPAPFNLDIDGESKVRHWLRLADYFHFPGVLSFAGLADLLAQLGKADLEEMRGEMRRHYEVQREAAVAVFRHFAERASTRSARQDDQSQAQAVPLGELSPGEWQMGQGEPLASCLHTKWEVSSDGPREIAAWTLRFGPLAALPRVIRLQVWRPVRVGWQRGERARTYSLVGENRAVVYPLRRGIAAVRHVNVSAERRIVAKPGDVLGWGSDCALGSTWRARGWRNARRLRNRATQNGNAADSGHRRSSNFSTLDEPEHAQMCVNWLGNECRFWPKRRVCSFHFEALAPDVTVRARFVPGPLGRDSHAAKRLAAPSKTDKYASVILEMSWEAMPFVMWFLECVGALLKDMESTAWTFLVCPPGDADAKGKERAKIWLKAADVFRVTVGVSLRCDDGPDILRRAESFLQQVEPTGPWVVLVHDDEVHIHAATRLVERNPSKLGFVIREKGASNDDYTGCVMGFDGELESPVGTACVLPVSKDQNTNNALLWTSGQLKSLLSRQLDDGNSERGKWALLIFSCTSNCFDLGIAVEPQETLNALLTQTNEAMSILRPSYSRYFRSVGDVVRMTGVRPALNVRQHIDATTTYEELMTLRQQLPSPDLSIFEDKIRLRQELLQKLGVAHTPTYYMSRTDPHILDHIEGISDYVVKPAHMTESEHVFVVHQGRHIFDVRLDESVTGLAGSPANASLIQEHLLRAWAKTAYEWECQAVVAARPGVIVERLIFAKMDPGAPEMQRVEEARCHVIWGRVMAIEWAVDKCGSLVLHFDSDRLGRHSIATEGLWTIRGWGESHLRDPDGWSDNAQACLPKIIAEAERVANGAHVDHLRVDFLVEGLCEQIYVSEVELFPAVPFAPKTMEAIEMRWRYGYGVP